MIILEPSFNPAITSVLSTSGLTRFFNRARTAVGLRGDIEVLLTSDAELKRLNRSFRGQNKPTDVLSFPAPRETADHHAGDLAISLETAARQAAAYGHTLGDEVRILLLHGLLHLSGLDHETDSGEMAQREAELRTQLKLSNTLIERTQQRPPSRLTKKSPIKKSSPTRKSSPAKKSSSTKKSSPINKPSSRPKPAHFAAAAERPPHFSQTASTSNSKTQKTQRGAA